MERKEMIERNCCPDGINIDVRTRKLFVPAVAFAWLMGMFAALIAFRTFDINSPDQYLDYAKCCVLGFGLSAPVIIGLCRLVAGKVWSRPMLYIVTALTSVIFVGIAINMAGYLMVEGAEWANPGFAPYSDSAVQFDLTKRLAGGEQLPSYCSKGFPLFELPMISFNDGGILVSLLINAFCMVMSATLCGVITGILLPEENRRKQVWTGTLLFAIIPCIPYYGTMFLKEAPVTLGFTLQVLALACLYKGRLSFRSLSGAVAGGVVLMLIKPHVGYILALGVAMCLCNVCMNKMKCSRAVPVQALVLALVATGIVWGGHRYRASSDFVLLDTENAEGNTTTMMHHETLGNYRDLAGDYYAKSPVERIAYLPVAAAVQYFPPFPWNFTRDTQLGKFVPIAHLSWLWYLVGGLVLAYFALCVYRAGRHGGLRLWALYWLACYLGVAYMSAGTVARYYVPFMALCVPLAVYILQSVGNGQVRSKEYVIYVYIYILSVGSGLAIAYNYLH